LGQCADIVTSTGANVLLTRILGIPSWYSKEVIQLIPTLCRNRPAPGWEEMLGLITFEGIHLRVYKVQEILCTDRECCRMR
jgi:hypothetical protein